MGVIRLIQGDISVSKYIFSNRILKDLIIFREKLRAIQNFPATDRGAEYIGDFSGC